VKIHHFAKREIGTNVTIEDEEGRWITGTNLVTEVVDASGCSKRCIFLEIPKKSSFTTNDDNRWFKTTLIVIKSTLNQVLEKSNILKSNRYNPVWGEFIWAKRNNFIISIKYSFRMTNETMDSKMTLICES
jgi:hypothetical protein